MNRIESFSFLLNRPSLAYSYAIGSVGPSVCPPVRSFHGTLVFLTSDVEFLHVDGYVHSSHGTESQGQRQGQCGLDLTYRFCHRGQFF